MNTFKKALTWLLIIFLAFTHGSLAAQEVISSATGDGYGMSGGIDGRAAWLTMGTAIRIIPAAFIKETEQQELALSHERYRYLPFALYLFPDGPDAPPADSPVYYNLHLSPDGTSLVRSSIPMAFNISDPGLQAAFTRAYLNAQPTAAPRVSSENLFAKRMLEVQSEGKGFLTVDWSEESHPELVKRFFFSEDNPLSEDWALWFEDWADANRAILSDYCAAISYFFTAHGLEGQRYTLPNAAYQAEADLTQLSLTDLYRELMIMFEATESEDQNWALIFEPVADFYPQGKPSYRAWTSATEIAQVMAERMYASDPERYEMAAEARWGESIKPNAGHYSRYQAALAYDLRGSLAFRGGDFVFSQARAIFTNNFSTVLADYLPEQYLLVDSLRPEWRNDNGHLGGWGIIYIKDFVPARATAKAVKYALLIDQKSATEIDVYGNLGYFSGRDLTPQLSYYDSQGEYRSVYLNEDRGQTASVVGGLIGIPSLADYPKLSYVATRSVDLDGAILPADFASRLKLSFQVEEDALSRSVQPVGDGVIGTARYLVEERSIAQLADAALDGLISSLRAEATAQMPLLPQPVAAIETYVSRGAKGHILSQQSPLEYAQVFKNAPASLMAKPVLAGTDALLSARGQELIDVSGNIPLIVGVRLPALQATGRFVTVSLDDEIHIVCDEEEQFDVSETRCRPVSSFAGVQEGLVLGWETHHARIDATAIAEAVREQQAKQGRIDLETLKQLFGADVAMLKCVGESICGAATLNPDTGSFDGFTVVEVVVKQNALDLSIETLESTVPLAGETATATVCVGNSASTTIETMLTLQVNNPAWEITFPVELQPGLTCFEVPFGTPEAGGELTLTATVNPDRQPEETDYDNNSKSVVISIVPPQPPFNPTVGCAETQTWTESRSHSRERSVTINKITSRWTEYCSHSFTYSAGITTEMEIDDYEGEIKSGYGIAPRVIVTGTGPTLMSETKGGSCWGGGPFSASEASVQWPDQAYFGWLGDQGHGLRDYAVVNAEKRTRQEADGIALEHSGTHEGISGFSTAANPLSNSNMRRIYTNVALRDGEHRFMIYIQNGVISYKDWSGCLATAIAGSIRIQGSMYEDDFTGAARP